MRSTSRINNFVLSVPANIVSEPSTFTDFPQLLWSFSLLSTIQQKHGTNSDIKKLLEEGQATSSALPSLQTPHSQNSLNQI